MPQPSKGERLSTFVARFMKPKAVPKQNPRPAYSDAREAKLKR